MVTVERKQFKGVFVTLLCIIFLLPVMSHAGSLKGKVTDRTDGSGLVHAVVTLIPHNSDMRNISIPADETGYYEFKDIPKDIYTLKVTYVGFSTYIEQFVRIGEDDTNEINIKMSPVSINMGAISVTTSRRPEKILDAPASVSLVESQDISERATLTATEHVKGLPAVDVSQTGLNQSNVVVRGFNNIFSGALLVLTDNRIARVPSLRFNAYNFIPTVNSDIERIEVVSGPGSALYGPNSANGVMHIITKSPFTSKGTTVSVGGGERDVAIGSIRHAGVMNEDVGYKFSLQYYEGNDWEHFEPIEPDSIALYRPSATGNDTVKALFENKRDFKIKKLSGEGRLDYLIGDNTSLVINGGFNQASSIELTGLGAGQAIDWTYWYTQTRVNYKDFFIQGFVNASDAGDTYLLNTGQLIVDKSKLWVLQAQQRYAPNDRTALTFGVDGLFTRPNTESTINGRNEDSDNINEYGFYVQGDHSLNEKVKLVGAMRVDKNDQLEDAVFSPRGGIVYQPDANNNFRFTYNRAFSTPDNNNLYLDLLTAKDPYGVGAGFGAVLPFNPDIDIRVQGVPESGFHWRINSNGPQYRSPFAPVASMSADTYIDFNDPMFNNVMWQLTSGAVFNGFSQQMVALENAGQIPSGSAAAISSAVQSATPTSITNVNNRMMSFNPDTRSFDPVTVDDIADIERMKPTTTQTLELGYKGIISDKLQFSIDAYRTEKDNFVGPLTVETPNVFYDPLTLQNSVQSDIQTFSDTLSDATQRNYLLMLDDPSFGGNGDTSFVDELTAMYVSGTAAIPFGTVTPEEQLDPNAVLITYRNFGEVTYYGADLAFAYHLNHHWNFGGTYSYVSKNFFEKGPDQVHDIYLNAPKNKFGLYLRYVNAQRHLNTQLRLRWVEGFDMASPFFGTSVETYNVVDFNLGFDIIDNTHLSLTVQNLFDNKHSEFVGGAELGRLAIMRVTQSF